MDTIKDCARFFFEEKKSRSMNKIVKSGVEYILKKMPSASNDDKFFLYKCTGYFSSLNYSSARLFQ